MKTLVVLLFSFVSFSLISAVKRRVLSVSGIFVLLWTLWLGLATLGLFEMNSPSWEVVVLSCVTMLIYAFSSCIKVNRVVLFRKGFMALDDDGSISGNKLLLFFHVIAFFISAPYLKKAIFILLQQGSYVLRNNAFKGSDVFASTAVLMIFQSCIQPLFVVTIILTIIDICRGFFPVFSIFLSLFDVVLYTVLFGGRYMLFTALIFVFFIPYDLGKEKNLFRYVISHKLVFLICFIIVVAMVLVSLIRGSSSILQSIYVYFAGSFTYLSYLIENQVGTNLFLLGRTQFGFVYNLLCIAATVFLGIEYQGSNHIITQLTAEMVPIGDGILYNSLGTMLHDFIADYGIFFCLIGVVILAITSNYVERVSERTTDVFHKGLYYYFIFVTVNTVFGFSFREPSSAFVLIYLLLFSIKWR